MTNPWSSQLQLINTLIAEKDQLVKEKDELVVSKDELLTSKDKLWRELHEIIRERDSEIQRLRTKADLLVAENNEIRTRAAISQLDRVKALDEERLQLKRELGQLCDSSSSKRAGSPSTLERRSVKKGKITSDEGLFVSPPCSSNPDEEVRDSHEASQEDSTDGPTDMLATLLQRYEFTVDPLISITDNGDYEIGAMQDIPSLIMDSICKTFDEIQSRHRFGKCPAYPKGPNPTPSCAWLWALGCSSKRRWTVQSPRTFACLSCFNARRACLLWVGNMTWMVLPLPSEARKKAATWEDSDYYIYAGSEGLASSRGLWRDGKD